MTPWRLALRALTGRCARLGAAPRATSPDPDRTRGTMNRYRIAAGLIAVPLLLGAGGTAVPDARQTPAGICASATKAFAQLAPPTSLTDARAKLATAGRLSPAAAKVDPKGASDGTTDVYATQIVDFQTALRALATGIDDGDPPAVNAAIAQARTALAGIDAKRKQVKAPTACSAVAFGGTYFELLAPVITTSIMLTGDFTMDMNGACSRLAKVNSPALSQVDPTDISSVESLIETLDTSYKAFQVDLHAITPPANLTAQYSALTGSIDQAVQGLDKANNSFSSSSKSQLQQFGKQFTTLGNQVTAEVQALGLTC